ncbi:hypothetical protein CH330_04575 [candidate division WOR-3 bacterium JGI_Cruoil_03_51_56]|uniref:Sigma-54 factor interaction domain-containing protein n=1 Tax=candidate division WOR-3 bacterium JGI_Cruoil_03_51_56 TaxID=1973747 RepID=A0A235BTM1_UNCW3|nr:MAG: hypothetical protein CH330_04575 [candidate division WOR-3 bacterium JGI_Cruoil_03_51_56]
MNPRLFYRMNVVSIKVPPLRERAADIPHLANFFVKVNDEKAVDFCSSCVHCNLCSGAGWRHTDTA